LYHNVNNSLLQTMRGEYLVSYYDYHQPEVFHACYRVFIEKDLSMNRNKLKNANALMIYSPARRFIFYRLHGSCLYWH
jgi:excinuclease UvrABC helicase subunit UvrB